MGWKVGGVGDIKHHQGLHETLTGPADDHTPRHSCWGQLWNLEQCATMLSAVSQQVEHRVVGGGLEFLRCGDQLWTAFCPDTDTCLLPPAGLLLQHTDTGPAT